jgi:hypothetical protein
MLFSYFPAEAKIQTHVRQEDKNCIQFIHVQPTENIFAGRDIVVQYWQVGIL